MFEDNAAYRGLVVLEFGLVHMGISSFGPVGRRKMLKAKIPSPPGFAFMSSASIQDSEKLGTFNRHSLGTEVWSAICDSFVAILTSQRLESRLVRRSA